MRETLEFVVKNKTLPFKQKHSELINKVLSNGHTYMYSPIGGGATIFLRKTIAEMIKNEDGVIISSPFLNDVDFFEIVEHIAKNSNREVKVLNINTQLNSPYYNNQYNFNPILTCKLESIPNVIFDNSVTSPHIQRTVGILKKIAEKDKFENFMELEALIPKNIECLNKEFRSLNQLLEKLNQINDPKYSDILKKATETAANFVELEILLQKNIEHIHTEPTCKDRAFLLEQLKQINSPEYSGILKNTSEIKESDKIKKTIHWVSIELHNINLDIITAKSLLKQLEKINRSEYAKILNNTDKQNLLSFTDSLKNNEIIFITSDINTKTNDQQTLIRNILSSLLMEGCLEVHHPTHRPNNKNENKKQNYIISSDFLVFHSHFIHKMVSFPSNLKVIHHSSDIIDNTNEGEIENGIFANCKNKLFFGHPLENSFKFLQLVSDIKSIASRLNTNEILYINEKMDMHIHLKSTVLVDPT